MGWIFDRPALTGIEICWRWVFGIPFLVVCWIEAQGILTALPVESSGLNAVDPQNPWVAAVQIAHAWGLYEPHMVAILAWLTPVAAIFWVVVSGLGRGLVLKRIDPELGARVAFRPLQMMLLQAAWLVLLGVAWWGWFRSIEWVAATHITAGAEPDLVGFACWAIFLSLGFFTAWALVSWALSIAPIVMVLEGRSAVSSLGQSFRLGKAFTGKLVEINMVMGIVNLALIILAMVFSAAPLPFNDVLGEDALHVISALAVAFYLVASDYFQVVRLKGYAEFWKMFRGSGSASQLVS